MTDPHAKGVRLARYPVRTHTNALEYGKRFVSRVWREADPATRASGTLAVHFDIDCTLLDESAPFVVGDEEFLAPNKEIVALLMHCMRLGFKVIIITARPKSGDELTRANLAFFQIPYHAIIYSWHKADWKRSLYQKYGIRFVMSVGDSKVDVVGAYAGEPILLRTPGVTSFRS